MFFISSYFMKNSYTITPTVDPVNDFSSSSPIQQAIASLDPVSALTTAIVVAGIVVGVGLYKIGYRFSLEKGIITEAEAANDMYLDTKSVVMKHLINLRIGLHPNVHLYHSGHLGDSNPIPFMVRPGSKLYPDWTVSSTPVPTPLRSDDLSYFPYNFHPLFCDYGSRPGLSVPAYHNLMPDLMYLQNSIAQDWYNGIQLSDMLYIINADLARRQVANIREYVIIPYTRRHGSDEGCGTYQPRELLPPVAPDAAVSLEPLEPVNPLPAFIQHARPVPTSLRAESGIDNLGQQQSPEWAGFLTFAGSMASFIILYTAIQFFTNSDFRLYTRLQLSLIIHKIFKVRF